MSWGEFATVFILFGLPILGFFGSFVLKAVLEHRVRLVELNGRQNKGSSESPDLRARCEALEKRCEKLEEQLLAVHADLADERRQLDRKLATVLPDMPVSEEGAARNRDERVKTIQ